MFDIRLLGTSGGCVMDRPSEFIDVAEETDALCITLRRSRLDESELSQMMDEIFQTVEAHPGANIVLSLGDEEPIFLYSVFLAKLVRLQRRVRAGNGRLKLADVCPSVLEIFQACHLDHLFEIYPDKPSALAALQSSS